MAAVSRPTAISDLVRGLVIQFALVFLGAASAGAQPEPAFADGEKLVYSVSYRWGILDSEVGSAEVVLSSEEDTDGTPLFHAVATGRTTRLFDLFFKVRERFESWFRAEGLRPVRFERDTYEGGYVARNSFEWIPGTDSIRADVYSSSAGQRQLVLAGRPSTYDLLSLFYYARTMDFGSMQTDVKYPISFAIDDEVYDLYFIIKGKERISIRGAGEFNTLLFAARLVAGEVFTGKEEMLIWVTDDRNRIPVRFESPIIVGTAYGAVKNMSGLKYPLDSKIR